MIRAFLFDMDGTLIDTEILWVEAIETWLHGAGCAPSHEDTVQDVYGVAWSDVANNLARRYPDIAWDREAINAHFSALRDTRDLLISSSIALLKRLAQDHPVAVVSGSSRRDIEEGIARMGIAGHLAFFLGDECCSPGKPHPACYLEAAQRLGLPPQQCLVFEDSTVGIEAAKQAGMHCVALARPGRPAQDVSRADWVLEDLAGFSVETYVAHCGG